MRRLEDDEVRSNEFYWIVVTGPGTESTWDRMEVGLPYRDEHGQIVRWEVCGGSVDARWCSPFQHIPFPEE